MAENREPPPPPRPDGDLRFVPADPEEGDSAQQDREDRSEEHVTPDEEERTQRDEVPHDGRGPDEERARPRSTRLDRGQLEFEGHHEFELGGRVAADSLHDLPEAGAFVPPPGGAPGPLLRSFSRLSLPPPPLLDDLAQIEPPSGPGRGVCDGPHGDRLRPERGEGRDQDDPNVAGRRRQAQDDPEDIDDSVLAPKDEVGEDPGLRVRRAFHRLVCVHGGPSRGTRKPLSAVTEAGTPHGPQGAQDREDLSRSRLWRGGDHDRTYRSAETGNLTLLRGRRRRTVRVRIGTGRRGPEERDHAVGIQGPDPECPREHPG